MQQKFKKITNGLNIEILKEPREIVYNTIVSINGKGFKIKSTVITFRNHMLIHCGNVPFYLYFPLLVIIIFIIINPILKY